jgi:hypothetical protein
VCTQARRVVRVWLAVLLCLVCQPTPSPRAAAQLPFRLTDAEFRNLIEEFSEPAGFFNSDNLVSNEDTFQTVIPELTRVVKPGGVYVGVGPDQNFTYIAALQPRMAFIADIRRGNLLVQLMYKALFELSADRAAFVARLFSRPGMKATASGADAAELLDAADAVPADREQYRRNFDAVADHLTRDHGVTLSKDDLEFLDFAYASFFTAGPRLAFVSNGGGGRNRYPSYRQLQTTTDLAGVNHAYLATEASFQRLKALEERNLIVPLVGNFAGPRALRKVGDYVRGHGATVTAFYTSNVEQYLFQDGLWDQFRVNVASMPLDETSTFIRSCFNSCSSPGGSRAVTLLDAAAVLLRDAAMGDIRSYWDLLNHSRRAAK